MGFVKGIQIPVFQNDHTPAGDQAVDPIGHLNVCC